MCDFETFIDSLAGDPVHVRPAAHQERFPCGQCAGTGRWSGGTNRHGNPDCLACRGRGYFTTPPKVRADQRLRAAQKKQSAVEALRHSIKEFAEANPQMWVDLCARKTEFTRSLHDQLTTKGSLSVAQVAAWHRGWEKLQAIRVSRQAEVNLDRIREMFDAAIASGYKKPCYRAEGLKISLASASGRNAGCLYVVEIEDDAYQGKIGGVTFSGHRETKTDTVDRLRVIASDPAEAAVRYGRKTGTCSCCGRELTNHASIEAGIGPICAQKWGF